MGEEERVDARLDFPISETRLGDGPGAGRIIDVAGGFGGMLSHSAPIHSTSLTFDSSDGGLVTTLDRFSWMLGIGGISFDMKTSTALRS